MKLTVSLFSCILLLIAHETIEKLDWQGADKPTRKRIYQYVDDVGEVCNTAKQGISIVST